MYIKYVFALIFIALVARFVLLDYVPPHLSNDEIGSAYAAYSISKTLKDGTGEYLPILWRSHGGYGAPLAVYIPLRVLRNLHEISIISVNIHLSHLSKFWRLSKLHMLIRFHH